MAGDGGRVPDVSEQRDISWGANCDRCEVRMNAGRASIAAAACGEGELLCGACRDEERLLGERDEALSDPASVLAALLAESPEATVAAIEALLTSDEAVEVVARFVSQQWHHAEDVDVDDYDRQEARKIVSAACRSLLSKAPKEDGDA